MACQRRCKKVGVPHGCQGSGTVGLCLCIPSCLAAQGVCTSMIVLLYNVCKNKGGKYVIDGWLKLLGESERYDNSGNQRFLTLKNSESIRE